MNDPKDCRCIGGDDAVIISKSTAQWALRVIEQNTSSHVNLPPDDASFYRAMLNELKKASES